MHVVTRWSDEDGEYVATIPSAPGLSALAPTEEEAAAEARALYPDFMAALAAAVGSVDLTSLAVAYLAARTDRPLWPGVR